MTVKLLAYCGLACDKDCPAFTATQAEDKALLQKTAARWSQPDYVLSAQDILCDGCVVEGKRLSESCSGCSVRSCARGRKLANCGLCEEYPCTQLENLWGVLKSPQARERLDQVRMESEVNYF